MKSKYKILVIVAPAVFLLDQLTKYLILKNFSIGFRLPVIPGFFDLVHVRNMGAAFGLLSNLDAEFREPFFFLTAIIASIVFIFFYRSLKDRDRLMSFAVSLAFGGMAGNILDRIRLGSVVDFLSFHVGDFSLSFSLWGKKYNIFLEWPSFNVADSAITVAMFLLLFSVFFHKRGFSDK